MFYKSLYRQLVKLILIFVFLSSVFLSSLTFTFRDARAACPPCPMCPGIDCQVASQIIRSAHDLGRNIIITWISDEFVRHREWMLNTFFLQQVLPALMRMTEQMSAVGMQQTMVIGMFFDAKHQLETQRLFQELQNQAHKDYQPSEDFCWFGSNVRSMAASEQVGRANTVALSARQISRHLGNRHMAGAGSRDEDKFMRWKKFTTTYCDPQDNNFDPNEPGTGLQLACGNAGGGNTDRVNIDIDYTRMIEEPRSLDVRFVDNGGAGATQTTPDEEDVIAMGNNLFGHDVLTRQVNETYLRNDEYQHIYMALRSVAAKRSVAENSYNAIVGLKSAGTSGGPNPAATDPGTYAFLGAVMQELGVTDDAEIYEIIGPRPSYYAQLEILAKKIYQNPDFYANLYDKPANVARKNVALKAIELMLDRAIYESQLRQEMSMSVLLSSKLRDNFRDVNKDLSGAGDN